MEKNIFSELSKGEDPVVAILSFLVLAMFSVIVFQWRHTANNTVPLFIWKSLAGKVDDLLKVAESTATIIDERLKK